MDWHDQLSNCPQGGAMQYRMLGNTGKRVSALGFGLMRLPILDNDPGRIDMPLAEEMLDSAIEKGINYFDTAWPYHNGLSEPFLGRFLKKRGLREKVFVATKLPVWEISGKEDFDRIFREQLRRLETSYIDFYFFHALTRARWERMKSLGALDFFESLKREGRIGEICFSFHDDLPVFDGIISEYDWAACLLQYNFIDLNHQAGYAGIKKAAEKGIGVIVMEPLKGGSVINTPPGVNALWNNSGKTWSPASWALRWVLNHPEVSMTLSGMTALQHVKENIETAGEASIGHLSPEDLSLVEKVRERYAESFKINCTNCGYCEPCPAGVAIPKIFKMYNDGSLFGTMPTQVFFYGRIFSEQEKASACKECGACEEACPQKLPIIEHLKECGRKLAGTDSGKP